jgi:hypothetical protein
VYPVSKDVGKVGNNSPTFIIPIDSKENKSNIANFFAKGAAKQATKKEVQTKNQPEVEVKKETGFVAEDSKEMKTEKQVEAHDGAETKTSGIKREADDIEEDEKPPRKSLRSSGPAKSPSPQKGGRPKISATSNNTKTPQKSKQAGTQEITKFFGNSS